MDGIGKTLNPELMNIAGRYVPDMRLLKNVRNEFIVFRDRILSGDGAKLNLDENELLGMMLYKSTHLADFELIRLGKSNLDKLYEYSRTIVTDNVHRIDSEISSLQQSSGHLKSIDVRSKELGSKLLAYIERTARHASMEWRKEWLSFKGIQITAHELQQSEFWISFLFSTDGSNVTYISHYHRQVTLQFSPKDVSSALNINLERDYWEKLTLQQQEESLEALKDDLKFLKSADMGGLIKRPEFKSLADSLSLHDKAISLLTNGLAYQLVRANAINRNFTLYTATFHGKFVTPTARSFIIHNVEQDKMDMHYQLNEADVYSLIKECGVESLGEPAFYNIAILDCLLRTRPNDTYKMVARLKSFGDEQRLFLQAYFSGGRHREELVARLIYNSPQIFKYLISTSELDADITTRQKLVSAALGNAWRFKGVFTITKAEADFMLTNYASLDTLTVDKLEGKQIQSVVKIFLENGIRVPDLSALSESFKQEFIKHDLYELNIDNLTVAIGGYDNLSLDALHKINKNVYNNVIANLPVYLDLIDGIAPTVADNSYFISILEYLYQVVPDQLDSVISRAHESCVIMGLDEVQHDLWSCLARHKRFPATFGNILAYTTKSEGIDANLATILLASEQITETNLASQEDKRRVAIWLLSESEELPNASLRVNLTVSLGLKEPIDVEDIPAESGELFALMVDEKNKIVEDSKTTYAHIVDMDWPTKESFICKSGEFANYIDSELLAGDLTALLQSQKIDINKKRVIVARADDLIDGFSTEDFVKLAQFAVRNKCGLSIYIIAAAALARAKSEYVLDLLEPHLSDISDANITGVLQTLGGSYEALTHPGPDRPSFPNDKLHNALMNRLKQIGIVTKPTVKGNYMWVNKRRS
jgi:roadblock/LC7 domain-containing protein